MIGRSFAGIVDEDIARGPIIGRGVLIEAMKYRLQLGAEVIAASIGSLRLFLIADGARRQLRSRKARHYVESHESPHSELIHSRQSKYHHLCRHGSSRLRCHAGPNTGGEDPRIACSCLRGHRCTSCRLVLRRRYLDHHFPCIPSRRGRDEETRRKQPREAGGRICVFPYRDGDSRTAAFRSRNIDIAFERLNAGRMPTDPKPWVHMGQRKCNMLVLTF